MGTKGQATPNPVESHAEPPSGGPIAAALRGFGPLGILAILVVVLVGNFPVAPMGALLVLAWVRWTGTPWREIGYVRPRSWLFTVVLGMAIGIALKLLMKSIVMPLLGAPAINPAYHDLAGNTAALPGAIYLMVAGGGFGEETVFRGFLFERLGKLVRSGVWTRPVIVLLTSVLFGLLHYPEQGLAGAEQATITGLLFGTIFAATGRIWLPMVVHAAFDLAALAIIYWNLETKVAHLVFH